MPNYRRVLLPGGTYFFTVVTRNRMPIFTHSDLVDRFLKTLSEVQSIFPFQVVAYCIMPEHIHYIWTLPENDSDYPKRWQSIKGRFANHWNKGHPTMRMAWQRGYWEHTIRDEKDLYQHIDYIHYNPIKHRLVENVQEWKWSSFHQFREEGVYDDQWGIIEPLSIHDFRECE